jgi:hypothetical protein
MEESRLEFRSIFAPSLSAPGLRQRIVPVCIAWDEDADRMMDGWAQRPAWRRKMPLMSTITRTRSYVLGRV